MMIVQEQNFIFVTLKYIPTTTTTIYYYYYDEKLLLFSIQLVFSHFIKINRNDCKRQTDRQSHFKITLICHSTSKLSSFAHLTYWSLHSIFDNNNWFNVYNVLNCAVVCEACRARKNPKNHALKVVD